jgi:hypothetical protein
MKSMLSIIVLIGRQEESEGELKNEGHMNVP